MTNTSIYQDIATRTDGDIYLGIVGPVRTGKSTFIKRFMETMVIPNIENVYVRERAKDELPQSGSGRTIMTSEPKFVPEEAVSVELQEGMAFSVRLIDCVGYMVRGAAGQFEDGAERMVTTPWYDHEVPITQAAEEGTRRVIAEHSTIGVVMTTDGSICDIPRESYVEAEERVIAELKAIGKPFVLLLNCVEPGAEAARALSGELSEKYGVDCLPISCPQLTAADIEEILRSALREFPLAELSISLPPWLDALPMEDDLKDEVFSAIRAAVADMERVRDAFAIVKALGACERVIDAQVKRLDMGTGRVWLALELPRALYYQTISRQSGFEIRDDGDLMALLMDMKGIKTDTTD